MTQVADELIQSKCHVCGKVFHSDVEQPLCIVCQRKVVYVRDGKYVIPDRGNG